MWNCGVSVSFLFLLKISVGCKLFAQQYMFLLLFPTDDGSGPLPLPQQADNKAKTAASSWNARDLGLSCHVTTHRIVLLDEKDVVGGSIPFPLVQTAHAAGGPSFRSPRSSYKIELSTHAWGELTIVFRGGETNSYTQSAKHRDDALDAIHRALKRKAWNDRERQVMKEALRPSRAIAARKVGVDAIMTQNELRREYTYHMSCITSWIMHIVLQIYSSL